MIDTRIRKKKIEQGGKEMEPEDRLPLAMIGGVGFAVTMFWFAWTAEYKQVSHYMLMDGSLRPHDTSLRWKLT